MNDERPIEKLLRRYAQQRRDAAGEPPALHPATRRRLQGEVARQYPPPARETAPGLAGFFGVLARRWLYVVGMAVVLALATALLLPSFNQSKHQTLLAQKTASEGSGRRDTSVTATAPVSPPNPVAAGRDSVTTFETSNRDHERQLAGETAALDRALTSAAVPASAEQTPPVRAEAESLRPLAEPAQVATRVSQDSAPPASRTLTVQPLTRGTGAGGPANAPTLAESAPASRSDYGVSAENFRRKAPAAPAPPPAAAAPIPAPTANLSDKRTLTQKGYAEKDVSGYYTQSFANVAAKPDELRAHAVKGKAETPVMPVLANFQVQGDGAEVRVIDGDGSVYRGVLSAGALNQLSGVSSAAIATNLQSAVWNRAQSPTDVVSVSPQADQSYLWRAEGTNRTLNQNVVFTWNFVETTTNLAKSQLNPTGGALKQTGPSQSFQFPALLNNSIINGRAQLGSAQQIEVNAVPVKQ